MPTNEFEKQVQEQLVEFQLNPSASVWEKVEEQIREKKRRRIIFFFLLPLALGLAGISFYYFLNSRKKTGTVQQAIAAEKKNSLSTDQNTISKEPKEPTVVSQQGETIVTDNIISEKIPTKQKPGTVLQSDIELSATHPVTGQVKKNVTAKNNRSRIQTQQDNILEIATNVPGKQKNAIVADEQAGTDKQGDIIYPNKTADKKIQSAEVTIAAKEAIAVKADSIKTGEVVIADNKKEAITIKKGGKPKIKWGIDLSGGIAFNNKGTPTFARAQAFDMNYNGAGNSTGTGTGAPPPPSPIIPPSLVRSGPTFKAGIVGELQVSERSRFSAGLQYVYAGNRIKTGVRSDTVVQLSSNNFSLARADVIYRGAQKNNYTNSYHFVSIPVWYHWQINKGNKLPIQWNVGISLGYMIATNALVYDRSIGGIYYENKEAFTKLHVNLGTGFSFRLRAKNRGEWVIGPELSFDMSRLVKNDNKQYLLLGGIHAKMFFPKKKNK